jgi:hypothetical protein
VTNRNTKSEKNSARITAGKNRTLSLYRHIQPVRSEYDIESDQSKIAVPKYSASDLIEVLPELYICDRQRNHHQQKSCGYEQLQRERSIRKR